MVFCFKLGNFVVSLEIFVSQVERIAGMLNYFLLQLVGPQRKALRVKDPEKYEFRPKELLAQVWPKVTFSTALVGYNNNELNSESKPIFAHIVPICFPLVT
jgi:hypothetical protein